MSKVADLLSYHTSGNKIQEPDVGNLPFEWPIWGRIPRIEVFFPQVSYQSSQNLWSTQDIVSVNLVTQLLLSVIWAAVCRASISLVGAVIRFTVFACPSLHDFWLVPPYPWSDLSLFALSTIVHLAGSNIPCLRYHHVYDINLLQALVQDCAHMWWGFCSDSATMVRPRALNQLEGREILVFGCNLQEEVQLCLFVMAQVAKQHVAIGQQNTTKERE